MKLLNRSLLYLSIPIFLLISIWSVVFYFKMLDEIYDSIDDGLDNYKLLIIQKSKRDSTVLHKSEFDESNYAIRKVGKSVALNVKDVYSDTLMYMLNEEEMEPVRMLTTAFRHQESYYKLKVISSMVEEDDQIDNLTRMAIWLYVILILGILIINNFVLQKLWKPFYELLENLKRFRIDKDKSIPDIPTNIKEFREFKSATNTLIEHSVRTYNRQKQFTENAAHEMQTPLAVITNKLELLLEEGRLSDADAETIAQVMQTTDRLVQYNKALLLLSKIENRQYFDNQSLVLNELVKQTVNELEDFADFKRIKIKVKENVPLELKMDAQLANILVSNLIKNAIFHNLENGRVNIHIESDSLTISNTSKNGPLDESKIYERYYRTKKTDKQKSTGLGLPIVKAICQLYHFKINYGYSEAQHFFTVTFE